MQDYHSNVANFYINGRTRLCWIDSISQHITSLRLTLRGATDLANDQGQWRSFFQPITAK